MTTYITPTGTISTQYTQALRQPHILIAGASGSGKSALINGLIATLLYRLPFPDHPQGCGLILIDPKRVELVKYKDLPHVARYTSEVDDIYNALTLAVSIMDRRYNIMQERGETLYNGGDYYVVIDEYADLMTTQAKRTKPLIQRLSQIGRAAKVHVILATQCPLAQIIPTSIKVNFDCLFALRTRSKQDSRNIIGFAGCEILPRYGYAYYIDADTVGAPTVHALHYTEPAEIARLIDHWQTQDAAQRKRKGKHTVPRPSLLHRLRSIF